MTDQPADDHIDLPDEEVCEVCVTAPDADWLAELTTRLVTDRLAACGHLGGPIRSIYRWAGTVHDEPEHRVALHTRRSLVPAIVARIIAAHPYEVPGIFVLPFVGGSPDYLRWVLDETTQGS